MIVYSDILEVPAGGPQRSVAIGVFDGLHLGHQAIIRQTVDSTTWRPAVVTFDRHPAEVLSPSDVPPYLTTDQEQRRLLGGMGVVELFLACLDRGILEMEPEAFVQDLLLDRLQVREVVVGEGFRFGRHRRGDLDLLVTMGRRWGFSAVAVPLVFDGGEPISSTRIRSALATGDARLAARLLGRPYAVTGPVIAGAGRGRELGVPTANVRPPEGQMLPANGVYAVRCFWDDEASDAVLNLGLRPTFDGRSLSMEAHLLSGAPDLYGRDLRVEFIQRLREERAFESSQALVRQIAQDVDAARLCLRPEHA